MSFDSTSKESRWTIYQPSGSRGLTNGIDLNHGSTFDPRSYDSRVYDQISDGYTPRTAMHRPADPYRNYAQHDHRSDISSSKHDNSRGAIVKEEEREGKRDKFQLADYMISTTGFQGPSKMWEAPYKLLKFLWLAAFLAACAVMVIQLISLFTEFFSYPVKTTVGLKFSPLALPSVTFCNVNPIRKSYASELSCAVQHVLKLPDEYKHDDCLSGNFSEDYYDYFDFSDTDCYGCEGGRESLDGYFERRQQINYLLGEEERYTRVDVGHQVEDMVVDCSLFGRQCSFLNVTPFLSTDYGNCYTYSTAGVKSTKSGPGAALDITFNLEPEEFVTSFKTGYGLRVVLHENGTRAFPSTEGFTISSGTETNIGLRLTQVSRKSGYGDGCDEGAALTSISGYKYTITNCRNECWRTTVFQRCRCVPVEDEADLETNSTIKYCTSEPDLICELHRSRGKDYVPLKEFQCENLVYEDFINRTNNGQDLCTCKSPCRELIYSTTISSRVWPVLSYVSTLEAQVCAYNEDSPKCSYANQDFTVESVDFRRSSFTRLRLYYERLNYESVEESPFYDTERFLSDIGGTLGLWIGVTVLGLAELLELLILCLLSCCKRMRSSGASDARPDRREERF